MKLDHLVLLASDLHASLIFYETLLPLLGYRKTRDHVFVSDAAPAIELKQAGDAENAYGRYAPGLNHFGFAAPSLDAVEHVRRTMIEAGLATAPLQELGAGRALFLPDPDGLRVEVTAYGPD